MLNRSQENTGIQHFVNFLKRLNSDEFKGQSRSVIYRRDRLAAFYSTCEFEELTFSTFGVMVEKSILRSYSLDL